MLRDGVKREVLFGVACICECLECYCCWVKHPQGKPPFSRVFFFPQ